MTAWDDNLLRNPHAAADKRSRVQKMFAAIAPSYDLNNRLHSLWMDQSWRKKAVELANALKAQVTLIHVAPPSLMAGDMPLTPVVDLTEAQLARGASILRDVADALDGFPVMTRNLIGAPAEVIADIAVEDGFDLVIAGNKGRGAVSRVLLGSVADRLLHISKRPVMVVR